MNDQCKTKAQLLSELAELRQRVAELEASEAARKQAEEALRQSEERQRTLVETARDVIFTIATDGILTSLNSAFETVTGWTRADWLGQPFAGFLHSENLPLALEALELVMRGETPPPFELRIRTQTGEERMGELILTPQTEGGKITGALGIARDITERKRAVQVQAALYRISEATQVAQNLEQLFDVIHAVVGELMPATNFYIALYDASADLLSFPYHADEFDNVWTPVKPGKSLTGYVLRTGKPLLATPEAFEQLLASGEAEVLGAPSVDWLGVP